ncbi:MAG: serine hydrolase domain-containing protein [Candidatus Binatia bacterium]
MDFGLVEASLKEAVAQGVFPGVVVLVAKGDEVAYLRAFGFRSLFPEKRPMQPDTIFDLASLTKPLATTTAIMLLIRDRKIQLDDRVTQFVPNFGAFGKITVTLRHLLAHCSGLPAWKPYYEEIAEKEKLGEVGFVGSRAAKSYVFDRIHQEKLIASPGTRILYSDLGFMLLGEIVEEVSGQTLDRYCQDKIFHPMGLQSTSFVDLTQLGTRRIRPVPEMIASTEACPWRKKILCGEVHDENAFAMGGVTGHAGLFSSARDIHVFLSRIRLCYEGLDPFLPAGVVREFFTRVDTVEGSTYALGWDTPASASSSSGGRFSHHSVGHLGFTGVSLWWDLERHCHIILLTNRIHPLRGNDKIQEFRPYLHDLIMKTIFQ